MTTQKNSHHFSRNTVAYWIESPQVRSIVAVAALCVLSIGCNRVAPLIVNAVKTGKIKSVLGSSDDIARSVKSAKKSAEKLVSNPGSRMVIARLAQQYRDAESDRREEEQLLNTKYSRLGAADKSTLQTRVTESASIFEGIASLLSSEESVSEDQESAISDYLSDYTESSVKVRSFLRGL